MKQYFKNIIIFSMSAILLFVSCPLFVYASDHGGGGGTNHNPDFITDSGTINVKDDGVVMYYIEYILANIGAILKDHDLSKAMANDQTMKEYISKGKYDSTEKTVTFPEETVTYVYNTFNNYAAENQPFTLERTWKANEIPASFFRNQVAYQAFRDYTSSHPITALGMYLNNWNYNSSIYFADVTPIIQDGGGFVLNSSYSGDCKLYNANWLVENPDFICYQYTDSSLELTPYEPNYSSFSSYRYYNEDLNKLYGSSIGNLVTSDGGRIKVFKTKADFMDYSVGQRKIYYTSEYYNYVPEDLQVSIDDLQKTIDGMQSVIDKLLDQITNNTSESEIEELLRQILEELKNNQGGSSGGDGDGGSGSGGGDVNVDIDLSGTNSLLSKILAKVTQISEKISTSAGQSMTDVVNSIKELGEMLQKYLKTITGDLDEIKNHLDEMTEEQFSEKADSFLNETAGSFSEIGEVAKGKFPFSIPNDMRTLLELLSIPPPSPETAALYDAGSPAIQPLSGGHGGGGSSRPPTVGIASVEQGSGGGSFGISESGAPVIRCPIVIKRLGIDYAIKIDLSEFDKVAALARTFLTFLFIYGLYNLTFKVIGLWGDLTE